MRIHRFSVTKRPLSQHLKRWSVPAIILLMAAGIVFLITGNWNTWASEEGAQKKPTTPTYGLI